MIKAKFGLLGNIRKLFNRPNRPPSANAGNNQVITLPTSSVFLIGSATDSDGSITSYLWQKFSGPSSGTITSPNSSSTFVTGLVSGTYVFKLTATDNKGATGSDTMTVVVNPAPNQLPTVTTSGNQTITLPTNSVTVSSTANDPDGTIVSRLWSKTSGPSTFTINSPTSASTIISNLVAGTYTFQITVTDNSGASVSSSLTIVVNAAPPANQPPSANAGGDKVITLPTTSTTLVGTGLDPDGTIASYSWSKTSGPATFNIVSPSSSTTVVNNLVAGTYQFTLTVTDNLGATGSDTVSVTVNPAPNQPPVANAGLNSSITLPTSSTSLFGSGADPDGTISAYAWTQLSGPNTATIAAPSSATTGVSGLIAGVYTFQLTVTDNAGATDTDTVTVTVIAAPVVDALISTTSGGPSTPSATITLPSGITLYSISTGSPTVFQWTKISGGAATIAAPNGSSTAISGLVAGTYVFQLQAWNGSITDTAQITVVVNASPAGPTYYVAPNGDDTRTKAQASNINTPWKTWDRLNTAGLVPGDTVLFRGGTYQTPKSASAGTHWTLSGLNGAAGNTIKLWAYPGETPVFTAANIGNPTNSDPTLFRISNCNYIHIKGVRFTTLPQIPSGAGVSRGIAINNSSNNTFELMELDHIGGYGFILESGCNSNYFLNCDAHHMGDQFSTDGGAWGNANGFQCTGSTTTGTTAATANVFEGCRAWWISDDGFDFYGVNGYFIVKNCWSFWNGYIPDTFTAAGDGDGFKLGPDGGGVHNSTLRVVTNCLSFENRQHGFNQNNGDMRYTLYNNTAYKNGHPEAGRPVSGYGFMWDYISPDPVCDFKNNISFANQNAYRGNEIIGSKNTWSPDLGITVTNSDFVSVSSVGADGPRQADGSLPNLNFLKLAATSPLINKGVNVGLPFLGSAPDIGAYEKA